MKAPLRPGRGHGARILATMTLAVTGACKPPISQAPVPAKNAASPVAEYVAAKLRADSACQAANSVAVVFREDGPSAVPQPEPKDRDWKPKAYDPLAPSRADGKPTFSTTWFTNNIRVWQKVLAPRAGKPNLRYLEVGVFEGRSLVWAFEHVLTHPSSSAVAIDLFAFPGLEERFRENLKRAGVDRRTQVLVGHSNEELRGLAPDSFDIIYIDGSHLAKDTLRDGVLAWDLLKVGGILIFDDYLYDLHLPLELRPQVAIKTIISAFHNQIRILDLGLQAVLQKVDDPCPGLCTRVGPYELRWNDDPAAGVLYDPRTKARVPLTASELKLLQNVLAGRVFGRLGIQADEALVKAPELAELRSKLGI